MPDLLGQRRTAWQDAQHHAVASSTTVGGGNSNTIRPAVADCYGTGC